MTTVIFATPSASHAVCLDYKNSAILTDRLMVANGIGTGHLDLGGDYYLWKVRSKLASLFLRNWPEATDLFFLDDDIGWPAEKVLEFLNRPEPILVGIYPKKQDVPDFPVALMADAAGAPIIRDGLCRVVSAGAGFLRIKRPVLEALAKVVPTFKESFDNTGANPVEYHGFFAEGIFDGWAWGEDKYFFAVAQENGFEVWADPAIPFTHRGGKTWRATLADHLQGFGRPVTDAVAA